MKIHLTKKEDDVLWLIQRKAHCLDLRRSLKMKQPEVREILASLAEKLKLPLINEQDVNKGNFWKMYGEITPPGQK